MVEAGGAAVDPRDHTYTTDGAGPHRIRIGSTARRPLWETTVVVNKK